MYYSLLLNQRLSMSDETHITADLEFKSRFIVLCIWVPLHDRFCTAEVYVHVFLADQDHNER